MNTYIWYFYKYIRTDQSSFILYNCKQFQKTLKQERILFGFFYSLLELFSDDEALLHVLDVCTSTNFLLYFSQHENNLFSNSMYLAF